MTGQLELERKPHRGAGSVSPWVSEPEPAYVPLTEDVEADVCVIGAGITGLTVAHLLSRTRRVVVLDRYGVGAGDSGRTTAHLTRMLDHDYADLEKRFGEDGSRMIAASHGEAIDFIERTVAEHGIECDFGRLIGLQVGNPGEEKRIERAVEAARRAGIEAEALETRVFETPDILPCLGAPGQAQFHPLRYLQGLASAIESRGGLVFGGTAVSRIAEGGGRVETSRGHAVSAEAIVVATHAPLGGAPGIHAKQAAYRSYVIAAPMPRDLVPRALLWDTSTPYHYVRWVPRSEREDLLVVGGEDHPTGKDDDVVADRYEKLEKWARERFPSLGRVEYRWSGQLVEPLDGLGFAGPEDEKGKIFFATGHSGNGMTHGTLSGLLLAGLIEYGRHEWQSLYDPGRKSLRSALAMAKEGVGVAVSFADRIAGEALESERELEPGEGAILRRNGTKVAAYRDEKGTLVELSAKCPHMGCLVRWNATERSWDCPCHGSRFDPHGRVLNAPATADLAIQEEQ